MTSTEADNIKKLYKNYYILNYAKDKISEVSMWLSTWVSCDTNHFLCILYVRTIHYVCQSFACEKLFSLRTWNLIGANDTDRERKHLRVLEVFAKMNDFCGKLDAPDHKIEAILNILQVGVFFMENSLILWKISCKMWTFNCVGIHAIATNHRGRHNGQWISNQKYCYWNDFHYELVSARPTPHAMTQRMEKKDLHQHLNIIIKRSDQS